jgi:hypothetical protein
VISIRRAFLFPILSFVAVACIGPSDVRTVAEPAELRAHIAACHTPESRRGHLAEISFEPTNSTPAIVAAFLSSSRLWSFGYQVNSDGAVVDVEGLPLPVGAIDLLPPEQGGSTGSSPPPLAYVPLRADTRQVTLVNVLLGIAERTHLKASGVEGLEGASAATALGLVSVSSISFDDEAVDVSLRFEWDTSLSSTEFQPKGSLRARLRIGQYRASSEGASYVVGEGDTQDLTFTLPPSEHRGRAVLVLDQFSLFHPGPLTVDARGACG